MSNKKQTPLSGEIIDGKYELTFPIGQHAEFRSFRAKSADGEHLRIDLLDLARMPIGAFVASGDLRSVLLLAGVDHPNIGKLRERGEVTIGTQKFVYLAFDLVCSETLAERLAREGTMPPFNAVLIISELLQGLEYLHSLREPLVHNGISPDSVSIDYRHGSESPVLYGFENLRSIHDARHSIALEMLPLFYCAPELANGIFLPQSDIFAVGSLLYHLIFGLPPWYDERVFEVSYQDAFRLLEDARRKPLKFDRSKTPEIDPAFLNAVQKCLQTDPALRFANVEELRMALSFEVLFEDNVASADRISSRSAEEITGSGLSGFGGIAGMESLKEMLYNEVIRPITETERFRKFGIPLLNGILLHGPPGCGKTYIAERLAEEIGYGVMEIKPSDLASPYVHGGKLKIGEMFEEARGQAPCMIFIDEIDAVLPKRDSDISSHYAAEVNEFLAQMSNCGENEVFVIAATNKPEMIDIAALRAGRFDKLIYIPPPDSTLREQLFRANLAKRPAERFIDLGELADLTDGFVSADITRIVIEAAKIAEKKDKPVSADMLKSAIKECGSSVPRLELERYEEIRIKFENIRDGRDRDSKPIGFV